MSRYNRQVMKRWVLFAIAGMALFGACASPYSEEPSTPAAVDGGGAVDAAGPDAGAADARVSDAADAADAGDAVADPNACKGMLDGQYCSGNQITWPGSKDDLITCKAKVVAEVRTCATGGGCIRMAAGFPDECDGCGTKPAGTYCGRDFGWGVKNADRLVTCQAMAVVNVSAAACPQGCNSNGAASSCK